ncbi:MAG: hypothetical protein ACK5NT_08705 [Pyrinomonadaceae bacterium]
MKNPSLYFLPLILLLTFGASASAQVFDEKEEPLPDSIREKMEELRIKEEKESFEKTLNKAKELAEVSKSLESSFAENKGLTKSDQGNLARVESLIKDVRSDLHVRGKAHNKKELPKDTKAAIKYLSEHTSQLFDELEKSSRYSISVATVQATNSLLHVVKFLRSAAE